MTGRSLLADACTECFPGDHPAVVPHTVTPQPDGSLLAEYRHDACGHEWTTSWDAAAAGWPVPERAAS